MCLGNSPIKLQSSTQKAKALSPMEAEYYALVKAASQGIGMFQMLKDLGLDLKIVLHCDNQSAIDFTKKQGLGKSKHINTGLLWLQDSIENNEVVISKVHTDLNIADIMTKYLTPQKRNYFMSRMGMEYASGSHSLALRG